MEAGVIAALTHYQFNPTSPVPALGAIAGVIGCYVRTQGGCGVEYLPAPRQKEA
jgi:membrane associated rhomboid family serine protease